MAAEPILNSMQSIEQLLLAPAQGGAFTPMGMLFNMSLALVFGLLLASVYRYTHKGLSYSQSFTITIVFVTTIVAIALMAIESSLARAFALVGALSIIRFRTVVKDTKDTAYVFAGLAVGLSAGTGNYYLAVLAGAFVCIVALVLHKTNFGASTKNEFILRFTVDQSQDDAGYLDILNRGSRYVTLLQAEPSRDGQFLNVSYDVSLKSNADTGRFARDLSGVAGVSEVRLIASKTDVDY